jgi:diguanylate cyclase (GGDEF)-like protein
MNSPKRQSSKGMQEQALRAAVAVIESLEVREIAEVLLEAVTQLFQPHAAAVLVSDAELSLIRCIAASGVNSERLENYEEPLKTSAAAQVFQERTVVIDTRRIGSDTPSGSARAWFPIAHRGELLAVLELTEPAQLFATRSRGSKNGKRAARAEHQPAGSLHLLPEARKALDILLEYAAIAISKARHVEQMRELIITDDCTSLYNSRHLYQVLEMEIYRSERFAYPFSCLFLDLDRFKRVNDTYGHLVGSRVLRSFGDLLRDELRKIDYIFRYGGDEFVILLPQTPKDAAVTVAQRLLSRIRNERFLSADGLAIHITASIGLVTFPEDAVSKEALVRTADEMMYRIKNSSRDGVAAAGWALPSHSASATTTA